MTYNTLFTTGFDYVKKGLYNKAAEIFTEGYEKNDPKCTYGLALLHLKGWHLPEDEAYATKLFEDCFNKLEAMANDGDAEAAFILFTCYYSLSEERFIDPDFDLAFEWLDTAADGEYPDALFWLGIASMCGTLLPVAPDLELGLSLLIECAEMGMSEAMLELGDYYTPLDIDEAKEWYQKAIDLGNKDAEERLSALD